jgi:hypothetical protein
MDNGELTINNWGFLQIVLVLLHYINVDLSTVFNHVVLSFAAWAKI